MTKQLEAYLKAIEEIGVKEKQGSADNPRIIEYHKATTLHATDDEVAWCSSFVNWCFKQVGVKGSLSAMARSWLTWGKKVDVPQEGDVVVFSRGNNGYSGHVAFFIKRTTTQVYVLGGNQGDAVCKAWYPRWRVLGYRRYVG